jgi:hypothetical protein
MAAAVENAEALLAADRPAREKLLAMYADVLAAYEEDRELSWFVLMESMQKAFVVSEDVHSRWDGLAVQVIEQGQASGELRASVAPVRAEQVLKSVFLGTLFMWLKCSEVMNLNVQDELQQRLTLVLDGLAAPSGAPARRARTMDRAEGEIGG